VTSELVLAAALVTFPTGDGTMTRILALSTLVAALSVAAYAQEGESARDLFLRGQAAYTQGDYDSAVELWQEAWSIDPRPALQYNLAQAYGRQGELLLEAEALDTFIGVADPDDRYLPAARARLETLRRRIAETGVVVEGAPDGSLILVDGTERGRTPLADPIRLQGGDHEITVRAEGYADFTTGITVDVGDVERVRVNLVEGGGGEGEGGVPLVSWILWGTGAAALVTGVVLAGLAFGESDGAIDGTPAADTARSLALGADISFGVAAAAAATGLILFFVLPRDDGGEEATARLSPILGPQTVGLLLQGRL
jgi:hypothetical protein